MKVFINNVLLAVFLAAICSCVSNNSSADISDADNNATANYLTMKINGKEWKADHEIIGAFHPAGYDDAIIITGSKGPRDKAEQSFNLTLYKTKGPGIFHIQDGNDAFNVIQLAGLSEKNYLYGSMMGFNVRVNITKATKQPTEVEASFEGELTGNASDKLIITDGKFYFHE